MTCLKPHAARSPNTLSSAPGLWLRSNGRKPEEHRCGCVMAYITLSDVGDSSCACSLLGLKHLLGTNTQTLQGSWWCLWLPPCAKALLPPCSLLCSPLLSEGQVHWHSCRLDAAGGTLAQWQLGLPGGMCHPEGSGRWGFTWSWDTNLVLGRSASISSLLSAFVLPLQLQIGVQLSGAVLRLNPVLGAGTQKAERFGGHQVSHSEIRPLHGSSALHALQDIYLIPEAAAPFLSN